MTLSPDARRLVVARLREAGGEDGLRSARVRQAAVAAGVSERTMWRWLSDPPVERSRARYRLTEADVDAYVAHRANAAAVWRARYGEGAGPSRRTLQRAFAAELRPGDRAAIVEGAEGRRRHQVYLRWIKSDPGPLELTADVAFSLRLDDADHPAARFH